MEKNQNISVYRERLDKTLASHDLVNEENLRTLVKNQMLQSSKCEMEGNIDQVVEKRTNDLSNFLEMLKSASLNGDGESKARETCHLGWKLKQDTEEYRVMYREGPEGTPFHSLLVEGYVDGPVDVCLCISWESNLYKKWWPQSSIPAFKITFSECLQKVRIGEQISLVRMKVSWPLSAREAVVHYFEFEYFQDDLIVVLLNSISDLESVDRSTHGFTRDGIPDVQDVVRIDMVGGFALQKVNAHRSYFRTISNMDIKLDFVPPSFINFISRQLIGTGFRLYQKEVASLSKGDEDFGKALEDPLYTRIREALYSENKQNRAIELEEPCSLPEEHVIEPMQDEEGNITTEVFSNDHTTDSVPEDIIAVEFGVCGEIEEIEEEEEEDIEKCPHLEHDKEIYRHTTNEIVEGYCGNHKKKAAIRPEVKHALDSLEKIISLYREYGVTSKTKSLQGLGREKGQKNEKTAVKDSDSQEGQISSNNGVCDEVPKNKMDRSPNEPRNSCSSLCSRRSGSNSYSREANHNKIVPASPEKDIPSLVEMQQTGSCSSNKEMIEESPVVDGTTSGSKLVVADSNGVCESSPRKVKNRRLRSCCFHFVSLQLAS